MKYQELSVQGAYEITLEPRGDERGWFSRLFCQKEFQSMALEPKISQVNNSFSLEAGTLRGMHFQKPPFEETKLVRAVSGSAFDVCVDLREESATYLQWSAIEISADRRNMLFVPRGCAHGILTLEPLTELIYLTSAEYSGPHESGIKWDDPAVGIEWPSEPKIISEKDSSWPLLSR